MTKLKVFRTPIGFHDAYVAAPSRKAALAAWGSAVDLFARGVAEEVTDPALTGEALAAPGTVIRRSRGTAAEQLAALPPDATRATTVQAEAGAEAEPARVGGTSSGRAPKSSPAPTPAPAPRRPRPPRPSPDALDAAESALADATRSHRAALADLAEREKRLARERRDVEQAQADEASALREARDTARASYDAALSRWRTWGSGADD